MRCRILAQQIHALPSKVKKLKIGAIRQSLGLVHVELLSEETDLDGG